MIVTDPKMPFLADATNRAIAQRCLNQACRQLGEMRLHEARVVRHKPGRRCLIEYDVESRAGIVTLIGKARAKGVDTRTVALMTNLRKVGFGDDTHDGVMVPEPLGVIPTFGMWLQRKVPGMPATQLLLQPEVAPRIAGALWKLHQVAIPTDRQHSLADELSVLDSSLMTLARQREEWASRLMRLLCHCRRLADLIPQTAPCGIHRDFYGDQVLIDGSRVYLLDFDLYCLGDPMLDVGNFVGHLVEQSVRVGDAAELSMRMDEFAERYSELRGDDCRGRADQYATLTLARHIAISARMTQRQRWTPHLLALCEQRLGLRNHSRLQAVAV